MQPKQKELIRSASQPIISIPMEENINSKNKYDFDENEIFKIIKSALNVETAKKNFSKNNFFKRDDLILKTKENSVINFLISLQNKSISNLKNSFFSKINEKTQETLLKIIDYKNSMRKDLLNYDLILEQNKSINKEISDLATNQRLLNLDLRKSQNIISKIQIDDQSLKDYKLLYDEFLKYYPGKDPVNQMKELKINNNSFLNKFNEYNDLQRKLVIENKENQRQLDLEKKILNNVKEKYNRILESNNMKKMENKSIIEELNVEKKTLQKLKEDNNKYRKMLFNLYQKLIQAFKLNKKIKINPKYLKLTENDFYPDVMDDMEIFSYIKLMINNLNPSEKDKALKETIAYSNMITRIYLKNKNSLRYDPLNIFKELKSMMEEKEQKIIKLSDKVKDFEIKINNMELENKKLNNLLIHFNQERIKNMSNKSLLRAQRALLKSASLNEKKNDFNFNKNNNFNNFNNKIKRPKTGNKYIKIKNEKQKRNKSMDEKLLKENEKNIEFNNAEIKNKMGTINNFNYNLNFNDIKKKIRNKWLLENIQLKEFKKIKESKNKDKILKIHNQQPLVKCLNEFNRLIKQTNKLFLYKYKITPKTLKINNRQNYSAKYLEEKKLIRNKSLEEYKTGNKTEIKLDKENELSINIEHKIDDLIHNLENRKIKFIKN